MISPVCNNYRISRFIGEQIIGESVGNRCCCHFNLAKNCSYYAYNSYETIILVLGG